MIEGLIRARFWTFGGAVLTIIILSALGRHVRYEQSIASFFPENDPTVVAYRRAGDVFGSDQFVFVLYDDAALFTTAGMDRLRELRAALAPARIDGVARVESLDQMPLPWRIDQQLLALARLPRPLRSGALELLKRAIRGGVLRGDALGVDPAVRAGDAAEIAELKNRLLEHPLFRGTLIDSRGRSTALIARLRPAEEQDAQVTVAAIRVAADAFAERHQLGRVAVVGPPVLLADGFAAIEEDGKRLAFAGLMLIGIVTFTATRSLWWALVPIVSAWTVWLAADTALATLGQRLSLSSGPLVAQILVLTMPAASHLALHFRDALRRDPDRAVAARATLRVVSEPILWCAATGTIGYAALLTSNVTPIRQFGAILAVCTAAATLLTLVLAPFAMLPPFAKRTLPLPPRSRSSWLINRLTEAVVRRPAPLVWGTLLAVVPLACGIPRLRYESNFINAFASDSRVVQDYRLVEDRLGGIGVVYLVTEEPGPISSGNLDRYRVLDDGLRKMQRSDGARRFDHVISLATVLDPDGSLGNAVTRDFDPVAAKLDLINSSSQGELLAGFWNRERGVSRTMVRLIEQQDADEKDQAFRTALDQARVALGPGTYLTGLSHLLTQTTRGVIATQWSTVGWSAGGILLMLTLAFRGPRLAALAILPSLLAVSLSLGLMGWLGVKLDLATALVGSVALGLSVDDTFHCLLEFRRESPAKSVRERLLESYAITGPGVLLSSLAVAAGFLVLRASPFIPFVNFGSMVGIATLGSSIGNVILLPACLSLLYERNQRAGVPTT